MLHIGDILSKTDQKGIQGGLIRSFLCKDICPTALAGTSCEPKECPGVCDGNGGWINY
jgi:hypothetical protein